MKLFQVCVHIQRSDPPHVGNVFYKYFGFLGINAQLGVQRSSLSLANGFSAAGNSQSDKSRVFIPSLDVPNQNLLPFSSENVKRRSGPGLDVIELNRPVPFSHIS